MSNNKVKFFIHLLIVIGLACALFFGFFASLGWLTRHGESVVVPNVTGMPSNIAFQKISDAGLQPVVLDSAFYDSLPKLSIVSQTPRSGARVKEDRIVYIIINRAVAPMTEMPDLRGYSLNSASLLLKSFKLRLGKYSYTASPMRDAVIKQQIRNDSDIAPGAKIAMGTIVNLVVGDGSGSDMITVPNILGMQLEEAKDYLASMKSGIGAVTPDIDVQVADSGYIYKQSPSPVASDTTQQATGKMKVGGLIDVWIRKNP